MVIDAGRTVRGRVLLAYPYLWCWDIEDASRRRLESSWEDYWDAFDGPEDALGAGLARLDASVGARGAKAAARIAADRIRSALLIVRRDDMALSEAISAAFRAREGILVMRDRQSRERRRPDRRPLAVERRQCERRRRLDVDARIRTLGWSAVFPAESRAQVESQANVFTGPHYRGCLQ